MPNSAIQDLIDQFNQIKKNLEMDVESKRKQFDYQFNKKRIIFEKVLLKAHKKLKTGSLRYLFNANLLTIITAPLIYMLIVPLLLLDLFVSLYQAICFCPIKHARKVKNPHDRYWHFIDYGDADTYIDQLKEQRNKIKKL